MKISILKQYIKIVVTPCAAKFTHFDKKDEKVCSIQLCSIILSKMIKVSKFFL